MSTWTLKEKSTGDLEVTIEGEEWQKAVDKAFRKIARNVTLNGFRKGSAPLELVGRQVPEQDREAQAVQDNANDWLGKALDENHLEPISQPTLDVKAMDPNSVTLVYTFEVMPEVTVKDYKGLKYDKQDTEVTDDDFNKELDHMRETYADLETKEGAAEKGDTVNIDYEGFKDDVAFEGGKAENYNLELGSGSFIPGFEDQLIGTKAGDEKDVNVTFPEDYHADDLKGAKAVFKVKVNDVKTKVLPEVDDDFAKDVNIPNVETAEDLKKTIRERMESEKKNTADTNRDNQLMNQLIDNTEVDLPDALVNNEVRNQINELNSQVQQYGMSLDQYLKMAGTTLDKLQEQYREPARRNVIARLALEQVAKLENIEATDEDVDKEVKNIADQYGMKPEEVKSLVSTDMLKQDVLNEKAFDFIKENAVETEPSEKEDKKEEAAE